MLDPDRDPLAPAKGILLGVIAGGLIWLCAYVLLRVFT